MCILKSIIPAIIYISVLSEVCTASFGAPPQETRLKLKPSVETIYAIEGGPVVVIHELRNVGEAPISFSCVGPTGAGSRVQPPWKSRGWEEVIGGTHYEDESVSISLKPGASYRKTVALHPYFAEIKAGTVWLRCDWHIKQNAKENLGNSKEFLITSKGEIVIEKRTSKSLNRVASELLKSMEKRAIDAELSDIVLCLTHTDVKEFCPVALELLRRQPAHEIPILPGQSHLNPQEFF